MSRSPSTVTLYHVPSTGILATSRQAALMASLQDACESVADLKVGINPAEVIDKAMAAEVVELEGTFPVFFRHPTALPTAAGPGPRRLAPGPRPGSSREVWRQ